MEVSWVELTVVELRIQFRIFVEAEGDWSREKLVEKLNGDADDAPVEHVRNFGDANRDRLRQISA